jgi:hypothetical protein
VGICSTHAAKKIKKDETHMSKTVFDIVTEYPQIQHVPAEMEQATMHKHGRKDCHGRMNRLVRFECKEIVWYCAISIGYLIHPAPGSNLGKKNSYIEDNDPVSEVWGCSGRVIIFIGDHAV